MLFERDSGHPRRGRVRAGLLLSLALLLAACNPLPTQPTAGPASPAPAAQADGQVNRDALLHYSRDPQFRAPDGPVPFGTAVTLRLKTAPGDLTAATVRLWDNAKAKETLVPMAPVAGSDTLWEAKITAPDYPTVLWYRMIAQDGGAQAVYQDDPRRDGGLGFARPQQTDDDYLITVYDPAFKGVPWMTDAVVYQIFPDRFNNGSTGNDPKAGEFIYGGKTVTHAWGERPTGGDDFFGGDLQGVINKLDYLKDLGVTVLYFNPIFDAPSNHGYDTRDYMKIAPRFGDDAIWQQLVSEAGRRGIHVVLDGVFNHTGSDSIYFDKFKRYPTVGADEDKSSPYFSWYKFTDWPAKYESWYGFDSLPQLAENDAVEQFIFKSGDSVAQHWLKAGASGWRLDAAEQKGYDYWRAFRTAVKGAYPDSLIVGEFWQNAAPWLAGDQWDGVMNYRFRGAALGFFASGDMSPVDFDAQLAALREDYPAGALRASFNLIGSHDTERALTLAGGDKNKLRLMALLQFTSPGAPTIYYGDEAGLEGGKDPDDRRTYPWGQEDQSLLDFYRTLARIRHATPALRTGDWRTLNAPNSGDTYAFARKDGASVAVVAFNRGGSDTTLDLALGDLVPDGTVLHDQLRTGTTYTVQGGKINLGVNARWGALLLP